MNTATTITYPTWITPPIRGVEIRYTATIIVPDGTDTDCYGEPCLEGHGYTLETGWIDPTWSLWTTMEDRPAIPADTIDLEDRWDLEDLEERYGGDLEEMIRDRIMDLLGFIDHETGDGTYYGGSEDTNYRTGETATYAAHVNVIRRIDTPGVVVDEWWGQYVPDRLIELARAYGWEPGDDETRAIVERAIDRAINLHNSRPYDGRDLEFIPEVAEECMDWLNDHATDGVRLDWFEGAVVACIPCDPDEHSDTTHPEDSWYECALFV